jgi:thymidine kinase
MAKLYFRYGTVGSAKTLNLLAVAHAYELQQKRALVLKPALDTRFGAWTVASRAGLDRPADLLIDVTTELPASLFVEVDCVLIDEVQFLPTRVIEQLRHVASVQNVPVIGYGLRTDFRSRLFPGSQRMLELADSIEEVKTTCFHCNRKGVMNLKRVDGKATLLGPSVCLGAEELYTPVCFRHYYEFTQLVEPSVESALIDFEAAFHAGKVADLAAAGDVKVTEAAEIDAVAVGDKHLDELRTPGKRALLKPEPDCEISPLA